MSTASFPLAYRRRESLSGSLVASVLFHLGIVVTGILYVTLNFNHGPGWGHFDRGSAIRVNAVTSLPGVPLPHPAMETPARVQLNNPELYKAPPQPPLPPPPNAIEIQRFKELEKPLPPLRTKEKPKVVLQRQPDLLLNKRIQKQQVPPPPNAVLTQAGGAPEMSFSTPITTTNGTGAIGTSDNFGNLFGWYVEALKDRVSSNWLLSIIDPRVMSAPRVYVEFDVLRNGNVENVKVTQSSGNPEVDRSAQRAVLASNPLPALPSAYKKDHVHVILYFDFRR
ncbi:MAG TPA: TonB family protein [Terriglobia bacterium]|nr:TonB family protein [Terriglobia bacterium]